MRVGYSTSERLLKILLDNNDLDDIVVEDGTISKMLINNSMLHERRVSLCYDEDRHSKYASVFWDHEGIFVRINPRNYVDLLRGRTIVGSYAERGWEICVNISLG